MKNKKIFLRMAIGWLLLISTVLSVSVWADTAWDTLDNNTPAWKDVQNQSDLLLYAKDGSVVTVQKWNQAMAYIKGIYSLLADWPRWKTPFAWMSSAQDNSPIPVGVSGKNGNVVGGIGLGFDPRSGAKSPDAFIGFFDGTKGYYSAYDNVGSDTQQPLGAMVFRGGTTSRNVLDLRGFSGGIYISKGNDAGPNTSVEQNLLGWKNVDYTNTNNFNTSCSYRVLYNGTMFNAISVGSTRITWMGGDGFQYYMDSTKKAIVNGNGTWYQQGITSGADTPTTGIILKIEQLCLPSYN